MAWFAMAEFIKNFRNFASSNLLCASTPSAQDPIKELVIRVNTFNSADQFARMNKGRRLPQGFSANQCTLSALVGVYWQLHSQVFAVKFPTRLRKTFQRIRGDANGDSDPRDPLLELDDA
jgi:hypothetical protein